MKRTRVVCPCSVTSQPTTDEQRRAFGWRLVPATVDRESSPHVPAVDVFVWVCPACASLRSALLRAS